MALGTLGTKTTTSLPALVFNPANVLSPVDMASIQRGIHSDGLVKATNPSGVITTGNTHSNTTLDTLGSMTRIQAGMFVMGRGIVPGTYLISVNVAGSSAVLSQAATSTLSGITVVFAPQPRPGAFSFNGQLYIPNRGVLMVNAGDVVAVDNTGWPILVSAAAIAYADSQWNKV